MEICVDCLESARNAIAGGATRLELCSALSEGGLTPTTGTLRAVKRFSTIPVFAMIRARGGDFVYSRDEMDAMLEDLRILKDRDADGFVFGAVTNERTIRVDYCEEIIAAAQPLPVTFHRAFDVLENPLDSMETLIRLGFRRILTSGQAETALRGSSTLRDFVLRAGDRIVVVPGAGINARNVREIRDVTGAKEFHGSASRKRKLGPETILRLADVSITDAEEVRAMAQCVLASN